MASSATGVKRSRSEIVSAFPPSAQTAIRQIPKRVRRLSHRDPIHLPTILKSDCHGFAKHPARAAFLQSLAIEDHTILGLVQGLGSDFRSFLSIVDLNLFQSSILAVVQDFAARAISLTTLNIRAHSFCMADKQVVLASFASFYGHQRWPCDVANYVAQHVFQSETTLSISVLSGGGVRDVLIAEWCKTYYTSPTATPPQIIFVTSGTGRVFLIPFIP